VSPGGTGGGHAGIWATDAEAHGDVPRRQVGDEHGDKEGTDAARAAFEEG